MSGIVTNYNYNTVGDNPWLKDEVYSRRLRKRSYTPLLPRHGRCFSPNRRATIIFIIILLVITLAILCVTNLLRSSNITSSILPHLSNDRSTLHEPNPLIIYAYHETPNARTNAEFFIKHGLHDNADFVFILNGETDLDHLLPVNKTNIQIIRRDNNCFDLGAYAEILTSNESALVSKYSKFILLNASIRGPFFPVWAEGSCWSDKFLSRVTDKIKLVGISYNCQPVRHVQSMLLATDRIGINLLLSKLSISSSIIKNGCFESIYDAMDFETTLTRFFRTFGYGSTVMMTAFHSERDYAETCTHRDVLFDGEYYGINVHPYETIFIKANRDLAPLTLERLTKWHDAMNYSSYEACGGAFAIKAPPVVATDSDDEWE